jgi:hypothetical protein
MEKTIPVRIDNETRRLIETEAQSRRLKLSDIVREAIDEFIRSHNLKIKHTTDNGQNSQG